MSSANQLINNFNCFYCKEIPENPFESECCGKLYCQSCSESACYLSCKNCKSILKFKPCSFARNLMSQLETSCKFNCDTKYKISETKAHNLNCKTKIFKCTVKNCKFLGQRENMLIHMQENHSKELLILMENYGEFSGSLSKFLVPKKTKLNNLVEEKEKIEPQQHPVQQSTRIRTSNQYNPFALENNFTKHNENNNYIRNQYNPFIFDSSEAYTRDNLLSNNLLNKYLKKNEANKNSQPSLQQRKKIDVFKPKEIYDSDISNNRNHINSIILDKSISEDTRYFFNTKSKSKSKKKERRDNDFYEHEYEKYIGNSRKSRSINKKLNSLLENSKHYSTNENHLCNDCKAKPKSPQLFFDYGKSNQSVNSSSSFRNEIKENKRNNKDVHKLFSAINKIKKFTNKSDENISLLDHSLDSFGFSKDKSKEIKHHLKKIERFIIDIDSPKKEYSDMEDSKRIKRKFKKRQKSKKSLREISKNSWRCNNNSLLEKDDSLNNSINSSCGKSSERNELKAMSKSKKKRRQIASVIKEKSKKQNKQRKSRSDLLFIPNSESFTQQSASSLSNTREKAEFNSKKENSFNNLDDFITREKNKILQKEKEQVKNYEFFRKKYLTYKEKETENQSIEKIIHDDALEDFDNYLEKLQIKNSKIDEISNRQVKPQQPYNNYQDLEFAKMIEEYEEISNKIFDNNNTDTKRLNFDSQRTKDVQNLIEDLEKEIKSQKKINANLDYKKTYSSNMKYYEKSDRIESDFANKSFGGINEKHNINDIINYQDISDKIEENIIVKESNMNEMNKIEENENIEELIIIQNDDLLNLNEKKKTEVNEIIEEKDKDKEKSLIIHVDNNLLTQDIEKSTPSTAPYVQNYFNGLKEEERNKIKGKSNSTIEKSNENIEFKTKENSKSNSNTNSNSNEKSEKNVFELLIKTKPLSKKEIPEEEKKEDDPENAKEMEVDIPWI